MDRTRLIMALALSLVVLMSWPLIMRYMAPHTIEDQIQMEQPAPERVPENQAQTPVSPVNKTPQPVTPKAQPQPPAQATQVAAREFTINTPYWTVKMSNRGAVATSWILRNYRDNGDVREIKGADG